MRAMPRTCPSMRFNRFAHAFLMSFRMPSIYPHTVYWTRAPGAAMSSTSTNHEACCGSGHTGSKPIQFAQEGFFTCPMHPQIRQVGPGSCPICGMALEVEVATATSGASPELVDMSRRLWIGLVLALPVFVLEMGGHIFNLHMVLGQKWSSWLQFALASPVVLWAGWPF